MENEENPTAWSSRTKEFITTAQTVADDVKTFLKNHTSGGISMDNMKFIRKRKNFKRKTVHFSDELEGRKTKPKKVINTDQHDTSHQTYKKQTLILPKFSKKCILESKWRTLLYICIFCGILFTLLRTVGYVVILVSSLVGLFFKLVFPPLNERLKKRAIVSMLNQCTLCQEYNASLSKILQRDLSLSGISCSEVLFEHFNPWACCDCNIIKTLKKRGVPASKLNVTKVVTFICDTITVDATHMAEDELSGFGWIYLPWQAVQRMKNTSVRELYQLQKKKEIWAFLSASNFHEHVAHCLTNGEITWERSSLCHTEVAVQGSRGMRNFVIAARFSLRYNGWPLSSQDYLVDTVKPLSDSTVREVIARGCLVQPVECRSSTCNDPEFDWKFLLSEIERDLMLNTKQANFSLAYINIAECLHLSDYLIPSSYTHNVVLDCLKSVFFKIILEDNNSGKIDLVNYDLILYLQQKLVMNLINGLQQHTIYHHVMKTVNLVEQLSPAEHKWALVLVEKLKEM